MWMVISWKRYKNSQDAQDDDDDDYASSSSQPNASKDDRAFELDSFSFPTSICSNPNWRQRQYKATKFVVAVDEDRLIVGNLINRIINYSSSFSST